MRKILLGLLFAFATAFVACGDDNSTSGSDEKDEVLDIGGDPDDESSSSGTPQSNSSVEPSSSSYERLSSQEEWIESSSSVSEEPQSSSEEESSSSEEPLSSSEVESSSSEEPQSSSEDASSSSEEPLSSSEEESSSSEKPSSSDGSVYDATANTLKDLRNGQTYRTTIINIPEKDYYQIWMAENMNLEMENSWCGGGRGTTEGDCSVYGRLYTWATAMGKIEEECGYGQVCNLPSGNVRGVCPQDWHVPSIDELTTLLSAMGGEDVAGTKLKSASGWNGRGNGTDAYSFSALPAGGRYRDRDFDLGGFSATFWSSSERDNNRAYRMLLDYGTADANLNVNLKNNGYSVRCLKD